MFISWGVWAAWAGVALLTRRCLPADAAPCGGAQFPPRGGELIAIPDERILAIYNALRPFRSSQAELLVIADELEHTWHATVNAAFVRESAEVYQQRHKLRKGS